MTDAAFVNRLAHLFGTCRAHWPLVLEEAQASVFERQAAVVQQAAHFVFRVRHQLLIDHAMDAARQYGIEMPHQVNIIAVVASDSVESVTETLTVREVLLEAGKTAAERMPSCVDDLRIR